MRMRQIVFAVRDLAQGSARLAALLGLDAPYRDPGVAEFGLDNAGFVFGDQLIELVAPLREGTAAGRMLSRRGDGGYMLILQTDDFERERARFAALGVRTVWQAEHADIRAMHLHPKDIGGASPSTSAQRAAIAGGAAASSVTPTTRCAPVRPSATRQPGPPQRQAAAGRG
jgi:hypothetical protein